MYGSLCGNALLSCHENAKLKEQNKHPKTVHLGNTIYIVCMQIRHSAIPKQEEGIPTVSLYHPARLQLPATWRKALRSLRHSPDWKRMKKKALFCLLWRCHLRELRENEKINYYYSCSIVDYNSFPITATYIITWLWTEATKP